MNLGLFVGVAHRGHPKSPTTGAATESRPYNDTKGKQEANISGGKAY